MAASWGRRVAQSCMRAGPRGKAPSFPCAALPQHDLHPAVLRLAHLVGGGDHGLAFARATGDDVLAPYALAAQLGGDDLGAAQRQALIDGTPTSSDTSVSRTMGAKLSGPNGSVANRCGAIARMPISANSTV